MQNLSTEALMNAIGNIDLLLEEIRKDYIVYEGRSFDSMTMKEVDRIRKFMITVQQLKVAKSNLRNELWSRGIFVMH